MRPQYLAVTLVAFVACSTSTPTAGHSPVASSSRTVQPSASTPPAQASLLVMSATSGDKQTVSLVDRDGRVVASAVSPIADVEPIPFPGTPTASLPAATAGPFGVGGVCCGAEIPEVSTTNRRAYYLSGQNDLRYLGVDGSQAHAAQLPNVRGRSQAVFAVSPDDKRIAISLFDWSKRPMASTIYVEDLGGGHRTVIFTSTSVYEWPVAWRAGSLVVAVCCVLGGAPNPYAAIEYHVADPATGRRLAELGSNSCQVIGPLVEAGGLCNRLCAGGDVHNPPPGSQVCLDGLDYSGKHRLVYRYSDSNTIGTWAALAPDGAATALEDSAGAGGHFVLRADGSRVDLPATGSPVVWWLDGDTVLLIGLTNPSAAAALYRVSSKTPVPLSDALGFVQGVVPGIS